MYCLHLERMIFVLFFYTRKRFLKIDLFYAEIKIEKDMWLKSLGLDENKIIGDREK